MPPRRTHSIAQVLATLASSHWAIKPETLRSMVAIAARALVANGNLAIDTGALRTDDGDPLENTYTVDIVDGIATIPVRGAMTRYDNWYSYFWGATNYEVLARDLQVALNDPMVTAILFDGDTVGGEVNGMQELGQMILAARDSKPMAWYAGGDTCSAGYFLAAATGRVIVAPMAIIGGLGTYACITDFSKLENDLGIESIELRSSQSPKKNRDPKTASGRDDIQVLLDSLCEVMLDDIAAFRAVGVETVLDQYGQGGVFVGAEAVTAGLADDVGTYDSVFADLQERAAAASRATITLGEIGGVHTSASERTMKPKASAATPSAAAGASAETATPAAADPTPAAAATEVVIDDDEDDEEPDVEAANAANTAKLIERRVAAERARIVGIQALRRNAGEEEIIAACVADQKCTVADAALRLRNAEAASPTAHLEALRGDEKDTPAPSASATGTTEATTIEAASDMIANAGKPATQRTQR